MWGNMQTPEEYEVTTRVKALIRGLKSGRGYTKKDISNKLGIGLTTLDDYLNGTSSFRLGTLLKFAQICRVSLSDILENSEELTKLYGNEGKHEQAKQRKSKNENTS